MNEEAQNLQSLVLCTSRDKLQTWISSLNQIPVSYLCCTLQRMEFFVLVMLPACAAGLQDLSGKMFIFPQQTNKAHVRLTASKQDFSSVTVCHRSFADLTREHALFSLSTSSISNDFMIQWDDKNKEIEPHIRDQKVEYGGQDFKLNMWHSVCTTWDSSSGLVQVWIDGQPSVRKYIISGSSISGSTIIILGQEQDSHGGGFDINQSFVGMMSDVHMWDYVLSSCEIQKYVDELNFTPGNVLNWKALDFQIVDRVLIEEKQSSCH
ncbi:serum amyloid P-component-like isoform X1 [Betta splendens]|uniref:Serum amyloid P-component-like isoform X1 n=1 Tax=Betta splendens TaxID=158456 RepID=A0A6P7KX56_BETSP|nr:serum amyloid P-component-like isoform X1 [Betta splendens]